MANRNIEYNLSVNDKGNTVNTRTKEAGMLNNELEKATTNTRAYARARSLSESGTGASARDFAKQAQGLGGLVQVYATWAANIFAVGSAFRALSEAANTERMFSALNQLGAQTGVALGNVAKKFYDATGGAISFREAVESTTKGIGGGLSQKQLLELGTAASKISGTLGVALPDAVSRLTRGITKLEPELLDELGIYVRLDTAVDKYAQKLGKASSSLTQYERTQAFAVEVLKQAQEKYGAIDVNTNQFEQLLANLKDIAQQVGSVLNKGIIPLIQYLNSNPTALTLAVALFIKSIMGSLLPALSSLGISLKARAGDAENFATRMEKSSARAAKALKMAKLQKAENEAIDKYGQLGSTEDRVVKAEKLRGKVRKEILDIYRKDLDKITEAELARIKKLADGTKRNNGIYRELYNNIILTQKADRDLNKAAKDADRVPALFSTAGIQRFKAQGAQRKASILQTLSTSAWAADKLPLDRAFRKLNNSIQSGVKSGALGTFSAQLARAGGTAVILGTRLAGLATGFAPKALAAFLAFEVLDSIFSRNSKSVAEFEGALKESTVAIGNAKEVYKLYKDEINEKSIIASANATAALNTELQKTTNLFAKQAAEAGIWDNLKEGIAGLIPFVQTNKDKFAESISENILAGVDIIKDPALKEEVQGKLKEIFGIQELNNKTIVASIKNTNSPAEAVKMAEKAAALGIKIQESQEKSKKAIEGTEKTFTNITDKFDKLKNTFIDNSPGTQWALEMAKGLDAITAAMQDPIAQMGILKDLIDKKGNTDGFLSGIANGIQVLSGGLLQSTKQLRDAENELRTNEEQAQNAAKLYAKFYTDPNQGPDSQITKLLLEEYNKRAEILNKSKQMVEQYRNTVTSLEAVILKDVRQAQNQVVKILLRPLEEVQQLAAINVRKAFLEFLPKSGELVKQQDKLQIEALNIQKTSIETMRKLIDSNMLLKDEYAIARAREDLKKLEDRKNSGDSLTADEKKQIPELQRKIQELGQNMEIRRGNYKLDPKSSGSVLNPDGTAFKGPLFSSSLNILAEKIGTQTKAAGIQGQIDQILATQPLRELQAESAKRLERDKYELDTKKKLDEEYYKSKEFLRLADEQQQEQRNTRELEAIRVANKLRIDELNAQKQVYDLAAKLSPENSQLFKSASNEAQKRIDDARSLGKQEEDNKKASGELASELIKVNKELKNRGMLLDDVANKNKINDISSKTQVDLAEIALERNTNLGNLTEQQIQNEQTRIKLLSLNYDLTSKLKDLEENKNRAQLNFENRIADIRKTKGLDRIEAIATPEGQAAAKERDRSIALADAESAAITNVTQAKIASAQATNKLTVDQRQYIDWTKQSFYSLGDAIAEFAMKGKVDFKGLVDSMISDLIRLTIRMQMTKMVEGENGLGNFLGKMVGNLFGAGGSGGNYSSGNIDFSTMTPDQLSVTMAKGGAYDSGVRKFAQGGMFTNSIVNSPTLFKFAKGTGLMGEAGPEAIMPLTRDSSGKLGVSAQGGGSVDIVVNNYSGQQASTRETKDSRGNRKIEVIVGDMSASELNRPNSSSQQAMKNSYGIQPQLVRR